MSTAADGVDVNVDGVATEEDFQLIVPLTNETERSDDKVREVWNAFIALKIRPVGWNAS